MNFNPKTWQPIAIDAFGHITAQGTPTDQPSQWLRIYTIDGGIIDAKRCPLPERITCSGSYPHRGTIASKPALFCSRDGHFFSLTNNGTTLREVKPIYSPSMQNNRPNMHSAYPQMRHFGSKDCHHLMYETWVGPRTKGMEIDHINGNKMDWSLTNLEEVTPAENRKRAKILRCMRAAGNDPKQYSTARLKAIFAQYELMDGDTQMKREMNRHQEQ